MEICVIHLAIHDFIVLAEICANETRRHCQDDLNARN